MKLEKINPWLTLLANVGVLVGIAFLAIEIKQNTRTLEVNAYRELISQNTAFASLVIQEPELMQLARVTTSFKDLNDEARSQIGSHFYQLFRNGDLAYYQYEQGMLSDERLESALGPINDRICRPLVREHWANTKDNFVESYRAYIDSKIGQC